MQWRRSYCLYHPSEVITNFCRQKSCLMPLCPTCIRQHSQYHTESSIRPQYFNISETLDEVDNSLKTCILNLEQDKKRNIDIMKKIQSMEGLLKEKLSTAKSYIFQLLEQAFDDLESELQETLSKVNLEQGLHSLNKAEKVHDKLTNSLIELHALRDGLKSQKIMGSAIVFLKDKQPQTSSFHNSLLAYLDTNESYTPKIQFNNEAKNQILFNMSRLIRIEGKRQGKRDRQRDQPSLFKSRINREHQANKSQKLQKSYTPQKSTNYIRPGTEGGIAGFNNNSPYRDKIANTLKPTLNHSPSQIIGTESYRSRGYNPADYETKMRRAVNSRRQQQFFYQPIS